MRVNDVRGPFRRHAFLLLAMAAFAGLMPAGAAEGATQTLEPTGSAFAFASEPGDYIGAGQTRLFTPDESTFTSSFNGTTFAGSITPPGSWWSVEIAAPPGQSLTAGTYENAVRWPFNGPGQPGLSVTGEGRGCNTVTGRFVVARVEQTGDSLAFEAAFEQHCEGGTAALFGQIRIGPAGTDTLGPSLALPGNLTIDADGPTPVAYAVSAVDLGDSDPTVGCTPSSGSLFPDGTTTVTCTATDSSNNQTTRTFQVRVRTSTPLSLAVSRQTINFGQSVRVTAHLSPFQNTPNGIVSIYATPYGGTRTLLAEEAVDASGDLSVTVKPKKRTTFTAEWAGDDTYEPSSMSQVVRVRVITATKISGNYAVSGKYKLFHLGRAVKQTGTVVPNHARSYLQFVAQRRVSGGWRTTAAGRFRIRSNGSVTAYFTSGQRGTYRSRNVFAGDADHLGDASPWRYFKVTS